MQLQQLRIHASSGSTGADLPWSTRKIVNLPADYQQGAMPLPTTPYSSIWYIDSTLILIANSKLISETKLALIGALHRWKHPHLPQLFPAHLWDCYDQCTPADIEANAEAMKAAWSPAIEDWSKVVNQIQSQPYQHQLIHIAETIIATIQESWVYRMLNGGSIRQRSARSITLSSSWPRSTTYGWKRAPLQPNMDISLSFDSLEDN
jgi:hypothetical protein